MASFKDIIKGELVFDSFGKFFRESSLNSSFDERKRHDPIINIGISLFGEIDLDIDTRIKLLKSNFEDCMSILKNFLSTADITPETFFGVFDKQFDSTKNVTVWAEAISAFEQKRVDILVGAYRKEITSDAIFSSFHLDYSYSLFAYALADDVSARFKSRDASLKACLPREAPFIKHIDFIAKGNIIETEFEQCKILIKNKQVDIIINTESNLDDYVKSLTKISLEKGSPMFLVFHNTPKGHFLKSYFDEKIAKLAQENILNKLFPDIEAFKQAHIRP